jgi:hypothetical protein
VGAARPVAARPGLGQDHGRPCGKVPADWPYIPRSVPADRPWHATGLILYFLAAGGFSFVAGAAASLVVPFPARLPVWLGVAGIMAVLAGVSYDTRAITGLRRLLDHFRA